MNESDFELAEGSGNAFRLDFSRIRNASLGRLTLDTLMKILAALDGRIRVTDHVNVQPTGASAAPSRGRWG